MSKTKNNALTKNYGGKFGDQMVYRNRDGVSIMSPLPQKKDKVKTANQANSRRRFKKACRWAKSILQDPAIMAEYQAIAKGMKTPYIMAVTNYLRPPEIVEIIASDYSGAAGDKISVVATDDFKVTEVKVKITDNTGALIEQGQCIEDLSADCWEYTATTDVPSLAGVVITATATDIPNHNAVMSVTL